MSAIPAFEPDVFMTEAEYLAFEDASETKHEFVDGHVYDWPGYDYDAEGRAGATRAHNQLQVSVLAALAPAARTAGCQVFGSDMRLRVRGPRTRRSTAAHDEHAPTGPVYYYPDATVVCAQEPNEDDDDMHITWPCVIVEIVSRRSARIDHIEKLQVYRAIPSVLTYLIVHRQHRRIERHWRDHADAAWEVEVVTTGSVPIPYIGVDLAFDEVYAGVAHR
jgi:Uma2 family endonuclease